MACRPSWPVEDLPVLVLFDDWNSFFRSKRRAMAYWHWPRRPATQLERDLLPRFMLRQRWYAGQEPQCR